MRQTVVLFLVFLSTVSSAQLATFRSPRVRLPIIYEAPDGAVDDPNPDFPLHVQIATIRFGGATGEYHGYGSGNILEGSTGKGFDYTFECSVPFTASQIAAQSYEARWKKQPFKLELLMGRVGSDHKDTCTLQIALEPKAFDPADATPVPHGLSTRLIHLYNAPDVAFTNPDPDYPVRFHVISTDRQQFNPHANGSGTGNLLGSGPNDPARGAVFSYACGPGFLPNSQHTGFYWGRWVEQDRRLEILLQRTGSDKVDRCLLKTTVNAQPFDQKHP